MKKTVAAVAVGLLLIAGQAVAQNNSSTVRVGDRLGAQSGESSEFMGLPTAWIPGLFAAALLIAGVVAATDDDSASD